MLSLRLSGVYEIAVLAIGHAERILQGTVRHLDEIADEIALEDGLRDLRSFFSAARSIWTQSSDGTNRWMIGRPVVQVGILSAKPLSVGFGSNDGAHAEIRDQIQGAAATRA